MKVRGLLRFLITGLILILASFAAKAQTTPDLLEGLTPYQSFHGGDIDSINLSNGNLLLRIPLIDYPQRGGALKLGFTLVFNSKVASGGEICFGTSGCEYRWYNAQSHVGSVPIVFDQIVDNQAAGTVQTTFYLPKNTYEFARYAIVTADGALHPLGNVNGQDESMDATGFYANPTGTNELTEPTLLIDRNGIRFNLTEVNSTFTREDPNGNQIIENYNTLSYVDSVGRNIPFPPGTSTTNFSACPSGGSLLPVVSAAVWTVPGPNGGTVSFTFCNVTVNVNIPNDEPSPVVGISFPETLTQSIVLPNGTAWSFEYNDRNPGDPSSVNFGIPTTVILPTGGTISYTYETIEPSTGLASWSRWLASRTVNANDGTGPHTWNYSYANVGGTAPTTTVTDPLGNNTIHTFALFESLNYFETETQYYQLLGGTQTLLKTVALNYTSLNNGNIEYPIAGVVPKSVTTTWPNNKVSQTQTDYDSQGSGTWSYGNVIAKREYDYGTGAPGALLRTTTTQYEAFINSTYLTNNLLTLPSSVQITDGGGTQRAYTTYGYDENALQTSGMGVGQQHDLTPADGAQRGNRTSVHRWLSTNGTYLVSTAQYFDTGTVQTATDPKGNSTTYAYSATYECGYPTTVTNALSQSTTYAYDSNIGLVESVTDPNTQTTSFTYDNMSRLATASYPDHGYASITRQETTFPFSATLTKKITSSLNYVTTNVFDGVGRVSQSQLTSDPLGTDYTITTYDADGRKASETNPYRTTSDPTYGTTAYQYDALNRSLLITEPDGSTVTTSYSGNSTTVTDEAGKTRESFVDGLGRMTEVIENPGGLGYVTNYTYDVLNDLVGAVQSASHTRSFVYDSLARLTSSTNPETGTIAYTYDADGNVQTRKDARSIITTYTVDALNRVTLQTYSDGVTPTAQFLYDTASTNGVILANPIGRLSLSDNGIVESLFSYDQLGRVVTYMQTTPEHNSAVFSPSYTYDLAGDITSFSNGLGVTLSYSIDGARRTTQMTGIDNPPQYPATLAIVDPTLGFYPNGAIRKITYGNGLIETSAYNNRLQPCRMNVNSSGTALGTCTDAIPSGSVQDFNYGFNFGTADNGNVTGWTATGQQNFNRSYIYDPLNRLSTMSDSATNQACKGLSWVYDAWGNRTAQNVTSGTCVAPQTPVNTNNQLSTAGYTYDPAGNLTADGFHTYTYDAENRVTKVDGGSTATYSYDAIGHRVEKSTASGYVDYLYDLAANVTGEWEVISGYTGPKAHYAYMNGGLVAEYIAGTTYFVHKDHLGSTRLVSGVTQSLIDNMDYLPFGEQIAGDTSITHKFTGKERDTETASTPGGLNGLDNFGARYMASRLGRFMRPDDPNEDQDPADPQSWNLYSYVRNNPLRNIDPTGNACVTTDGGASYHDDESGGQTCAQASAPINNTASVTVNGGCIYCLSNLFHRPTPDEMQQMNDAINNGQIPLSRAEIPIDRGGAAALAELIDIIRLAKFSGILRLAAIGKGNFGLGEATAQEAAELGKAWVGDGATVATDGKTLISADKLRQYRPPELKPSLGKTQANFEARQQSFGQWQSNGHLDIK